MIFFNTKDKENGTCCGCPPGGACGPTVPHSTIFTVTLSGFAGHLAPFNGVRVLLWIVNRVWWGTSGGVFINLYGGTPWTLDILGDGHALLTFGTSSCWPSSATSFTYGVDVCSCQTDPDACAASDGATAVLSW